MITKAEELKGDIINIETWALTCELRWFETDVYDQNTDSFFRVLQQKSISSDGGVKWDEIPIVSLEI